MQPDSELVGSRSAGPLHPWLAARDRVDQFVEVRGVAVDPDQVP
nr:hypothetical protein [Halobaculum salinum]